MFTKAIVRLPCSNFGDGETRATLGAPDYLRAVQQHEAYCAALESCGLMLTRLEADPRFPDSTFVEDTAVLTRHCAVLTQPGAASRVGEVTEIKGVLAQFYSKLHTIRRPGTLDGGDVCEAENHLFIGISKRTNEAGAQQLATLLSAFDYTSSFVDIRDLDSILHLKSGLAYLGRNRLVVCEALAERAEFSAYDLVRVDPAEEYAANCVVVNERVLTAAGCSMFEDRLRGMGLEMTALDMSEFQKMDGGLSCLSLRF
ncbi:MAG: dimethylarginine dimethylaminohydrolase family protein [Pyrinomonadaceae bacterium]